MKTKFRCDTSRQISIEYVIRTLTTSPFPTLLQAHATGQRLQRFRRRCFSQRTTAVNTIHHMNTIETI